MAAMRKWLRNPDLEPDVNKSPFLMKAFLGHLLPRKALLELFQERRRQLLYDLEACQKKTQILLENILERPELEDKLWFSLLPLERCIALYETEIAWVDEVLVQLEQRQAKGQGRENRRHKKTPEAAKSGMTQ
jgi:hypothetical protein